MKCKQYTTVAAHGKGIPFTWELPVTLEADEARHVENGVINLYPRIQYQRIDGFGAAMTETSAYLFSKMDPETRAAALKKYFGPGSNQVTFLRMSVDSCDYSLEEYQAVADPLNDPDFEMPFTLSEQEIKIIDAGGLLNYIEEHGNMDF